MLLTPHRKFSTSIRSLLLVLAALSSDGAAGWVYDRLVEFTPDAKKREASAHKDADRKRTATEAQKEADRKRAEAERLAREKADAAKPKPPLQLVDFNGTYE